MPIGKAFFGAVNYSGKLFVIGGKKTVGAAIANTNSVEIYDPERNRWAKGVPMPTPRQCAAVVGGDLILVPGGYNGTTKLANFEFFSPKEGAWKKLPDLPERISATALAQLGKYLLFFGDYDLTDSVFVFDLAKRSGESFSFGYTPARHAAAVVHQERVYVVGGAISPSNSALDEIQVFALRPKRQVDVK